MPIFLDISQLRPIKDKLPASIGFGKLKFVLAMLEVHFGVEGENPPQPPTQETLQYIIDSAMQVRENMYFRKDPLERYSKNLVEV